MTGIEIVFLKLANSQFRPTGVTVRNGMNGSFALEYSVERQKDTLAITGFRFSGSDEGYRLLISATCGFKKTGRTCCR
jgi:hypothetical protein